MNRLKIILFVSVVLMISLFLFLYLESHSTHEYRIGQSSLNVICGYYKLGSDDISISRIDQDIIYCITRNYIFNEGESGIERQLPIRFSNPQEHKEVDWTINIAPHEFMRSPVACIVKNKSTNDSISIFINNFETTPRIRAYTNDTDTTLLLMEQSNFKRSNHCELVYIYAWPKKMSTPYISK